MEERSVQLDVKKDDKRISRRYKTDTSNIHTDQSRKQTVKIRQNWYYHSKCKDNANNKNSILNSQNRSCILCAKARDRYEKKNKKADGYLPFYMHDDKHIYTI